MIKSECKLQFVFVPYKTQHSIYYMLQSLVNAETNDF